MPALRMLALAFAKMLGKLFGLATITFFGRAPSRDDDKVGIIGLLSIVWLPVVVAAFLPALGETLFPFLPDDEEVIRGVAVGGAVAIPPVIGVLITRLENRVGGLRAIVREAVLAYGYATVIALLVLALVVIVPIVKVTYIFRMFDLKHIAVMIEPERFDDIIDEVRAALLRHGIETEVRDPRRPIRWVFQGLVFVEAKIFRRRMSRKMKVISGHIDGEERWFELTLHATDLSVIGAKEDTTYVMAVLSEELDEHNVYFSWDDGSQALEDRIRDAQDAVERGEDLDPGLVSALCEDLRERALSTEEWNAIRRQIYKLERDAYRTQAQRVRS